MSRAETLELKMLTQKVDRNAASPAEKLRFDYLTHKVSMECAAARLTDRSSSFARMMLEYDRA